MNSEAHTLNIVVTANDGDRDYIDRLARQLLREVRELDLDVRPASGVAVVGSKGADPAFLQALSVQAIAGLVPQLVSTVSSWLSRKRDSTVRIRYVYGGKELEIEHAPDLPPAELKRLIDTVMEAMGS